MFLVGGVLGGLSVALGSLVVLGVEGCGCSALTVCGRRWCFVAAWPPAKAYKIITLLEIPLVGRLCGDLLEL